MVLAGFEPWDAHVHDLLSGRIILEGFLLKELVGGFSYADVLELARGWAATILFNKELKAHFEAFYARLDTFLLAIDIALQLLVDGISITFEKGIQVENNQRIKYRQSQGELSLPCG